MSVWYNTNPAARFTRIIVWDWSPSLLWRGLIVKGLNAQTARKGRG